MARLKFARDEWRLVQGDGIEVELLMRRLGQLEQIEVSERLNAVSWEKIDTQDSYDAAGRKIRHAVREAKPVAGRYVDGMGLAVNRVVRGWRNVEDESGKPMVFSPENLQALTAAYPGWGNAMIAAVMEFTGIGAALDEAADGAVDPQSPPTA
ncbi:MAG TPA: hypothetical protein PKY77_05780 [Phycisphaerae bacterium]|nr:hypothetical protein [Phycisphaerae bacterium]HRY69046.1 hypothetical protein [Phycisphaerae bacterium]HSA25979.1 hypothetical protein [Phycisphaerae bacterium]